MRGTKGMKEEDSECRKEEKENGEEAARRRAEADERSRQVEGGQGSGRGVVRRTTSQPGASFLWSGAWKDDQGVFRPSNGWY